MKCRFFKVSVLLRYILCLLLLIVITIFRIKKSPIPISNKQELLIYDL